MVTAGMDTGAGMERTQKWPQVGHDRAPRPGVLCLLISGGEISVGSGLLGGPGALLGDPRPGDRSCWQ